MKFETVTLPSHWASYLINGDDSGLDDDDAREIVATLVREGVRNVVDLDDDSERFTWHYRMYGGNAEGGSVCDFIAEMVR